MAVRKSGSLLPKAEFSLGSERKTHLQATKILYPLLSFGLSVYGAAAVSQNCPAEGPFNDIAKYDAYGPVTSAVVDDPAGTCEDAFRIELATVQAGPYDAGFQILENDGIDDVTGKRYRVSFRYRADAAREVNFLVNSRRRGTYGDGGDHTYAVETLSATTEYQTYSTTFESVRAKRDRTKYHLYFLLAVGDATTPVYLDNVIMEEIVPQDRVAGTRYVNPAGSDANEGMANTASGAWQTLTYALSTIIPGDTLLIADGVYRESGLRVLNLDASFGQPTVIKSINRWGAKIEGTTQYDPLLKVESSSHVVVDGLEVYHPGETTDDDWATGIQVFGSNYVTVRNVYAHDCGCNGLSGREGDYMTFERNVARDNAKTNPYNCSGISIYQPTQLDNNAGPHVIIRDNVVFENECTLAFTPLGFTVPTDGNGIILDDYNWTQAAGTPFTAQTLVENNLAFDNGGAGIKSYEVQNAVFRNNTSYHNNRVLEEYTSATGEYGFQAFGGTIEFHNNVGVEAFGRAGHAVNVQSFGQSGTIDSRNNLLVGSENFEGTVAEVGNVVVSEDRQSYPEFADALAAVPAFTSVDDFRPLFGLRASRPGIDGGDDALAATTDLNGVARPIGAASDIGAFEGAVEPGGPLPPMRPSSR